jgi:hypothetical protein
MCATPLVFPPLFLLRVSRPSRCVAVAVSAAAVAVTPACACVRSNTHQHARAPLHACPLGEKHGQAFGSFSLAPRRQPARHAATAFVARLP